MNEAELGEANAGERHRQDEHEVDHAILVLVVLAQTNVGPRKLQNPGKSLRHSGSKGLVSPHELERHKSQAPRPQRGPFRAEDEEALMRERRIELLVSKNSGGDATAGKLIAARRLGQADRADDPVLPAGAVRDDPRPGDHHRAGHPGEAVAAP
eukprot:gene66482-biopygen48791